MATYEYKYTLSFGFAALNALEALPKNVRKQIGYSIIYYSATGPGTSKNLSDKQTNTA